MAIPISTILCDSTQEILGNSVYNQYPAAVTFMLFVLIRTL